MTDTEFDWRAVDLTAVETPEPVPYKCDTCGWAFEVRGEFDGSHGDARVPANDDTRCTDIAKPVKD